VILIGWNEHVAWGMTALWADQADLCGSRRTTSIRTSIFSTANGETWNLFGKRSRSRAVVRQTHFGPVVTDFAFSLPGEPQVALRRIPICESDRETIQGALAMVRAIGNDIDVERLFTIAVDLAANWSPVMCTSSAAPRAMRRAKSRGSIGSAPASPSGTFSCPPRYEAQAENFPLRIPTANLPFEG